MVKLHIGQIEIEGGTVLDAQEAQAPPTVEWDKINGYWALRLYQRVPYRYLQFLVVNIPGNAFSEGELLVPYSSLPSTGRGERQLQLEVYAQWGPVSLPSVHSRTDYDDSSLATIGRLEETVLFYVRD
jgi:hypothetical protein